MKFWLNFAGDFEITISACFDEHFGVQFFEKRHPIDFGRSIFEVLSYFVQLLGLSIFLNQQLMLQFLTGEICLSYLRHF